MTGQTGLFVAETPGGVGTTPVGARKALGGLLPHDGSANPLGIQTGVFYDGGAPVVAGTAGMSYDVRAFAAALLPSLAKGPVLAANDATRNISLSDTGAALTAPGSNSRIDVIYALQHLVAADSGSDSDVDFDVYVAKGTAAASPTKPSTPTGALELAQVTVPTGTTATNVLTFTQLAKWIGARTNPKPSVTLEAGSSTSMTAATVTKVGLAAVGTPDPAYYTIASSVLTIVQAGTYDFDGEGVIHSTLSAAAEQETQIRIQKTNGTARTLASLYRLWYQLAGGTLKGGYRFGGSFGKQRIDLAAGDTIELQAYQTGGSGSAQSTLHADGIVSRLTVVKVA